MNTIITKKYTVVDESKQWADAIRNALTEAEHEHAQQVAFRIIKDEYSDEFSQLLSQLNFNKKNDRVEYKKLIVELPDDHGSPMSWQTAEELKWGPQEVANTLKLVADGDPDTDPIDDPLLFIRDQPFLGLI